MCEAREALMEERRPDWVLPYAQRMSNEELAHALSEVWLHSRAADAVAVRIEAARRLRLLSEIGPVR